ncbi:MULTISPECIES: SLC13 family permease [unclassified Marinobacter]|uniref:SLC13 family permease n=1 Tax=unclassified Marinobacter TaxID=83889 RepID=UPI000BF66688|nr:MULTISPECIES: SLC13 family permease [unclassified Marinobacter]PFG09135.1 sodium:sulfate symporter-like transmembrane protein [Marinobacter sp. LV10MA510-1]
MSNQPLSVEQPEGLPRSQVIGLVVGLAGFLACLIIPPPGGMSVEAWAAGGMMLPIGLSIIAMTQSDNEDGLRRFGTALLPAIAYSASVGGIATLIGTPPNALLAAYLLDTQGIEVGFAQWMLLGLPVAVVMLLLVWWWLARVDFGIGRADDSGEMIRRELEAIAASCALMMPVATPPNAIVFSSGHVRIGDMLRAGFALNLMGVVVVTVASYWLMSWVFGL